MYVAQWLQPGGGSEMDRSKLSRTQTIEGLAQLLGRGLLRLNAQTFSEDMEGALGVVHGQDEQAARVALRVEETKVVVDLGGGMSAAAQTTTFKKDDKLRRPNSAAKRLYPSSGSSSTS